MKNGKRSSLSIKNQLSLNIFIKEKLIFQNCVLEIGMVSLPLFDFIQ